MAITLNASTPVDFGVEGRRSFKIWSVSGPASYTTGGTTFTPAEVSMSRIFYCIALGGFYNGTSITFAVLPAPAADGTQNLLFAGGAASGVVLAQITAATNLSAYVGLIKVVGTGL